ncbi:MAG TPA: glutamate formimidoyltransferase [Candidatus Tripitaka californicus]|uniref:glutamate formimidoyltransferase n=1 Tax=Candidatus Tripitaka californicus TaxID=3367616 RepID=UPI00402923B0|nr:glutamate formimidoyltransferase [Planctomycetota bacterium]
MKIVECVPNFSEGKDLDKIRAIVREIESTPEVKLLGVEPDPDYNRTVVTFAGTPEGVKEAARKAIARAGELIDMSRHRGSHPRLGAADVVPFVPIRRVTMEECVRLAVELAREVGEGLGIPVYLYREAARRPERRELANIRKGEYEGLAEKLSRERPDFGPCEFNERVRRNGATVIGARKLLIAYNVDLSTPELAIANKISGRVRETGVIRKINGTERIPGLLKQVQAMGVRLNTGITQVSMNLLDYEVTPPHVALEAVRREAEAIGVEVTASEIVGLISLEPLLMAGRFYIGSRGDRPVAPTEELIRTAIKGLALRDFKPEKKVIEYALDLG